MRYLDKRIQVICDELQRLRWKQQFPIAGWQWKKGYYIHPEDAEQSPDAWEKFDCETMHWYGPDQHYWFRVYCQIPPELDGKSVWLYVRTQIEEWDDAKNPQFLLFVNGEIIQGIDMNHREVLLREHASAGETLLLELQAYTGMLHSEFQLFAQFRELDRNIEKLYYDLLVPLEAFPRMGEENMDRMQLEQVLNNTVNFLDLREPYSEAFYASLEEASEYIDTALYKDLSGWSEVRATCIGHTHIDVAWWWTVEQTREKVSRSFATVLKLMEEYPDYKFMSSQPQLYCFVKERYPELYAKIKERVAQKRWEPEGGMWLEADTSLTSGESLVRQFLYGKRFFKEEFNEDSRVLWLPDVFGYTGALPQIMKKCGIDYFMTTKLSWNQFNQIPCDTFRWRGIDGTEVLTHMITTSDVGQPTERFFTTYNGRLHPDAIMGGWQRYQNKNINNDILISFGYGDGGGGPTREMLETAIRMEKGIRGIPKVRQEFSGTWFQELEEKTAGNPRLPVWEGELYFENHRGTLTSMARNKRANRKAEFGLMDLELLSVLASDKIVYPQEELEKIWKTVLLNQFHDILPGSAIHDVYETTKMEYAQIQGQIRDLTTERMHAIAGKGDAIVLFNTTGHSRSDIIWLESSDLASLHDEAGVRYEVQQLSFGACAYVKDIPAKGYKTFFPDRCSSDAVSLSHETSSIPEADTLFQLRSDRELETPFYSVVLNENGNFIRLYDKENDREIVPAGECLNQFRMYEDKPFEYDNWNIDIYYTEKQWSADNITHFAWTEIGRVCAVLETERQAGSSSIYQQVIFYSGIRRIDFRTRVDWKEHQTLLKVHFPLAVHTDEATFDIQFGNLTRKTHVNTSWEQARFESCGQKWVDLSEGHYGVSLLNDCKYGHSVTDNNLALTLIKSGMEPNPVADQEEHFFTYALYPHVEAWKAAGTVREAYNLNQPLLAAYHAASDTGSFSFAEVGASNVILETVKRSEDGTGIVLRLYEAENAFTKTSIRLSWPFAEAWLCNLLEEREQKLMVYDNSLGLTVHPYEAITIFLQPCRKKGQ